MRSLRYEELAPISRDGLAAALADGTPEEASEALLRLALHDEDFAFIEQTCTGVLDQREGAPRRAAVLALGHMARIHHTVSDDTVVRLRGLPDDPHLTGVVADALDDIASYVNP